MKTGERSRSLHDLMKIGGFEKYSFIDFPGCISSVVFTRGCNFHCPYCHNPDLVRPAGDDPAASVSEDDILAYLEKRRKYIDGVVVTGGEPFLQPDLPDFCRKIKALGLSVKIDTNGSMPERLTALIDDGLADYIAMDVKTAPDRYVPLLATDINPESIRKSIEIILASGLPHEFRTTCIKPIVDEAAFHVIAGLVDGAALYALQVPRAENVLDPSFFSRHQWMVSDDELHAFRRILSGAVDDCIVR